MKNCVWMRNTIRRIVPGIIAIAVVLFGAGLFAADDAYALGGPSKVEGVKVTQTTYDSVTLRWSNAKKASSYEIYRAPERNGEYVRAGKTAKPKFTDKGLQTGRTYWYKVRGVGNSGAGFFSTRVSASPVLEAPELLVESSGDGVKLMTEKVVGASGYIFYRDGKSISRQKDTTYIDKETPAEESHAYKAVAYRQVGGKVAASKFSRSIAAAKRAIRVVVEEYATVPELNAGDSFTIRGKIRSNTTIKWVEVGVVDASTSAWVDGCRFEKKDIDKTSYDISEADADVKFSSLKAGTYRYRVYAHLNENRVVTLMNQTFEVKESASAAGIVSKALEFAWPRGTSEGTLDYGSGHPKVDYVKIAYPGKGGNGQVSRGASCDIFVGSVLRACGYDPDYPSGLEEQISYAPSHGELFAKVKYDGVESLKPGDVLQWELNGPGGHTFIYVGEIDGTKCMAEAHYGGGGEFGQISKFWVPSSNVKYIRVYRPIR